MTERDIFLNALDQAGSAARVAYLDSVCAGKPALRRRVEQLLKYHRADDRFLEVSAMQQLTSDERVLSFLAPSGQPEALGRLDHYDVLEIVGRGATGLVLKARDGKLQRVVAIKVLAPRLAASAVARDRFVREAQAVAAVSDDHVIGIHDVNDEGPLPYLVMEYVAGITLADRIKKGGTLEVREILRIGLQVAKGLAAAHAQGLVHRDIKPGNILLENGVQRAKITDFGLALAAADAGLTKNGAIAGTPLFMSPEQARGEATDGRSDLFSLGAVLYTLCAGRPPFGGDCTAAVLKSVCEDTPAPIRALRPDIPEGLCELIDRLLSKEPGTRLTFAQSVADLLTAYLARVQEPSPAGPPAAPPSPPAKKPNPERGAGASSQRTWLLAILCLVGVLGTLAVFMASLKPWQRREPHLDLGDANSLTSAGPLPPLELHRHDIPPRLLALAGGGDAAKAPPELVAVLGDGRFLLPRVGGTAWMDQSPDRKLLAVPLDEDVVLFGAMQGDYLRTLKGPGGRVVCVTFSRDSRLLAATTWFGGMAGAVRVWDLEAGRELYTNQLPGPKIAGAAAFSIDGKRLVTEGNERLDVWDARSGRALQTVDIRPGGISSLSFSPDGRRLAVAVWQSKNVKVFEWDGDTLVEVRTLTGHQQPIGTVAYSPDGKYLASSDCDGFKLWDATTLAEVRTVETPAQQLAFAPDGRTLWAATTNAVVRTVHTFTRWAVESAEELPSRSVAISVDPAFAHHLLSRDGKTLFVVQGANATFVRAIDAATGKDRFPRYGHTAPVRAVAVSPDGRTVASAGEDRVIELWDLRSRRLRHTLGPQSDSVAALAFSSDGKQLASASSDGTIALWDMNSGGGIGLLKGYSRAVSGIEFSPDGRTLAAGTENGTVALWDVAGVKEKGSLRGHAGAVRCVALNRDGTLLASGGDERTVRLHNLATGIVQKFRVPNGVNQVAFSADGRNLAAVTDAPKPTVCLWDLEISQEMIWRSHTGSVHGLAFSPTAPLLATCGADGTVRLWRWTGSDPGVWTIGPGPFGGEVRSVAFTPDGRYLVTANANGTVYVLRVGTPDSHRGTGRAGDSHG